MIQRRCLKNKKAVSLNTHPEIMHTSDGMQTDNTKLKYKEVYESKVKKQGDKEETMQQECIFVKYVDTL